MAPLIRLIAAALLLGPGIVHAEIVDTWATEIDEAARRFALPRAWIAQVMRIESGGRTHLRGKPIRSRAGAMGLMQLMPSTWAEMRARLALGNNPDWPRDNILAGSFYLRLMYDRYGYPGLFAAYNCGPARYDAALAGRARLPSETITYLAMAASPRPIRSVQGYSSFPGRAIPRPLLFFARSNALAPREVAVPLGPVQGVFALKYQ